MSPPLADVKSAVLRQVVLPDTVPGTLWLTSMPGRQRPLTEFLDAAKAVGITRLICLAQTDEVAAKSPDYAKARNDAEWPFAPLDFPIPDFGIPQDANAFTAFIENLARPLVRGEAIAIHCAAGIGRTGLTAICLLIALGLSAETALHRVELAGSYPETPAQNQFTMDFHAHA